MTQKNERKEYPMKKQIVVLAAVAALAAAASMVNANTIAGTAHDLSGSSLGSTEICIFCHTPHNAIQAIPLWNRKNPSATYTLYETSSTLTTATKASNIDSTSISTFCMSCHDGVTALGNINNTNGATMTADKIGNTLNGNLGTNLANTHPVGFNYASAASEDSGLRAITTAKSNLLAGNPAGQVFFGTASETMECASCHSVHDNKNTHFLRQSNAGSGLCLDCHNK